MKYSVYCLLLIGFLSACQSKATNETGSKNSSCNLSGNFINKSALDRAQGNYGKVPEITNNYALELSFVSQDSVEIDNGFEKFRLAYTQSGKKCHFKLVNATTKYGDMDFKAENDSLITLVDTAWTKLPTPSTFKRARHENGQSLDYNSHFNDAVIAGTYLYKNKEGKTSPVHFLSNGQVTGLQPYLSYSLCYAGDCLEETEKPANTIEFTDDTGSRKLFAIGTSDAGELKLYSVADPKPDIKGERTIGEMVYVLNKEPK
jgi:hypothetical protein